ncbi:MAG: hypothetical protein ACR2RB_06575 [Gammaproteobacteria bacterium]
MAAIPHKLCDALRKANVDEQLALAAAEEVATTDEFATKDYIALQLTEFRSEIRAMLNEHIRYMTRVYVGTMLALTAIFGLIVKVL